MMISGPATYVDVVDDEDRVVGQALRSELVDASLNFRVAHVFAFNSEGWLLLGQLGTVRTNDPGKWGSSVAAHLAAGESYADAAQRRLREELGVTSSVHFVAKVPFRERSSLKFVGLFDTTADSVTIEEPDHVAALSYRPLEQVALELDEDPDRFTATFRCLFDRYRELRTVQA